MLKEQNQTLRSEILRQKAKDEAKALLTNAVEHQSEVLGPSSGVTGPSLSPTVEHQFASHKFCLFSVLDVLKACCIFLP